MSRRTTIVGGTVVNAGSSVACDVLVDDGVIVQLGEVDRSGADVIDATGCLVLPGAVDVHTHPFGAVRDDTRSALRGGTTTALAFVDALEGERPVEAARRTLEDELPHSMIDLAFHSVVWERIVRHSIRFSGERGFLLPYHDLIALRAGIARKIGDVE